jgi:chromosome segregation ATPase
VEIEWLDDLESRVRDAVERLGELREENRTLHGRVEELETRLSTLSIPPAEPAPWEDRDEGEELELLQSRVRELERQLAAAETERAAAAGAAKAWEIEREEVRRRVEALTERLEGLTEGSGAPLRSVVE